MALWGNKDLRQANTGTTDRATVTGTTTCTVQYLVVPSGVSQLPPQN